jgi:hypothetical protein
MILIIKPERARLVWKPWRAWNDNIKINLEEVGYDGVDCIHLTRDMN